MNRLITLILLFVLVAGCTAEPAIVPTSSPAPTVTSSPTPPTVTITPSPTATKLTERSGLIAFYMNTGGMGGIFVMNADGSSEPVLLSAHPTSDSRPSWSPDGKRIAFESLRDDASNKKFMDIYIMDADGSHLTKLTNTDGSYGEPEWSPDGKQILVVSYGSDGENTDLYIIDLITGDTFRLTDDPAKEGNASWSPDGKYIVFSSNRGGAWDIYTINVATGELSQLTNGTGGNGEVDWSPDGEKILFISNRDGDIEIYMMDADGEHQERLTNFPGSDNNPEWSPDGNFFVFSHKDSKIGEIYWSDLEGMAPERLFENKARYAGYPAWSANAEISNEPAFGPPFCLHDTDGDAKLDSATNTFTTEELWPFVTFPYRNMDSNLSTSIKWDYDNTDGLDFVNMNLAWKYGESGWYTAMAGGLPLSSVGSSKLTVGLYIGENLMQEIECEIISPDAMEAVNNGNETATPIPKVQNTVIASSLPEGWHDGVEGSVSASACSAFGWAFDPDDQDRDVKVRILSDGEQVATTSANVLRTDVRACKGGTCGFNVDLWGLVPAGKSHLINVEAFDVETSTWVNLSGTPKKLTCWGYPEGAHDGEVGRVDANRCSVFGWVVDPDDRKRDVQVRILSDGKQVATASANLLRRDVKACSGGSCGFSVALWGLISPDETHSISIEAFDEETNQWLEFEPSPKRLTCFSNK